MVTLAAPTASADAMYGNYIVGGRIEQEYLAQGGPGVVGNPTTPEQNTSTPGGKFQVFQNSASIYWKADVAGGYAKLVRGSIRDKWGQTNWENGPLGYPVTSETNLSTQNGKYNHFQGGSIYYTAATGAHPVFGAIRDIWAQAGWENSTAYGYPTSDEYTLNGGWQQQFQRGVISYNVGPEPDADPNGTNAIIGADDPYNRFARRSAGPIKKGGGCSTPDVNRMVVCTGIGQAAPSPSPSPTINQRSAPAPSAPSTTVPPTSESPTSTPSTESSAPSTSPTAATAPPSSSEPAPSTSASIPPCTPVTTTETSTTPATTTQVPTTTADPGELPCAPTPAAETAPLPEAPISTTAITPPTETGEQSAPQYRPFPELGPVHTQEIPGVPVPSDPARNTTAENAFFKEALCANAPDGSFFGKRFYLCGTIRFSIDTYGEVEGVQQRIGSQKGFIFMDGAAAVKSQAIDFRVRAIEGAANGVTAGTIMEFEMSVGGSGNRSGQPSLGSAPQPLGISPGQMLQYRVTTQLEKPPATNYVQRLETDLMQGKVTIVSPPYVRSQGSVLASQQLDFPTARCDNFQYLWTNDPGCIMAPTSLRRNLPVLDMTTTRTFSPPVEAPQLWDHILTAQNSGVAGSPVDVAQLIGSGSPLQRIPSPSQPLPAGKQGKDNRATACPSGRPTKPANGFGGVAEWSCDEYPFAATNQGAKLLPNNGRTRDWCFVTNLPIWNPPSLPYPGWSACYIPNNMNTAGGALLPSFHRDNRILLMADDPTDGYYVSAYH